MGFLRGSLSLFSPRARASAAAHGLGGISESGKTGRPLRKYAPIPFSLPCGGSLNCLMDTSKPSRRSFLGTTLAAGAATVAATGPNLLLGQAKGANSRVRVGVMGLGRGRAHIKGYLDVANTEVAYLCDVDSSRLLTAAKGMEGKQEKEPESVSDFRRILDDPNIDAISIAAPNFWQTPAAILACQAGKNVYVEKPGSYSAHEAFRLVEVAKDTNRVVVMGNQRRSYPGTRLGIEKLHAGAIGELRYARCFYNASRASIGKGKITDPPAELDWLMWQGPVPDAPYKDNLAPYNWHWHWLYGGGELANNGPHGLDIARWALQVDYPQRVVCTGGRYHFDDDQETPDTTLASYDFGSVGITWDGSSCHPRKPEPLAFVSIYGSEGKFDFTSGASWTIYDKDGKEVEKHTESPSDVPHFTNFVEAIREGKAPNQSIADAQTSTLLCHYGNIAFRSGGAVDIDPKTGRLVDGQKEAAKFWSREAYREGWAV